MLSTSKRNRSSGTRGCASARGSSLSDIQGGAAASEAGSEDRSVKSRSLSFGARPTPFVLAPPYHACDPERTHGYNKRSQNLSPTCRPDEPDSPDLSDSHPPSPAPSRKRQARENDRASRSPNRIGSHPGTGHRQPVDASWSARPVDDTFRGC